MNPWVDAAEQTTNLRGAAGKGQGLSGAREWKSRRDGGGIAAAGGWTWRAGQVGSGSGRRAGGLFG
jgi:hypothetical protein